MRSLTRDRRGSRRTIDALASAVVAPLYPVCTQRLLYYIIQPYHKDVQSKLRQNSYCFQDSILTLSNLI